MEDPDGREEETETETETESDLRTEFGLKAEIPLLNPKLAQVASLYRYPHISEHFVAFELMVTASRTFRKVTYEATMKVHSGGNCVQQPW